MQGAGARQLDNLAPAAAPWNGAQGIARALAATPRAGSAVVNARPCPQPALAGMASRGPNSGYCSGFAGHLHTGVRSGVRQSQSFNRLPRMLAAADVVFGPYRLDTRGRSLLRGGEPVALSPYEYDVLHLLVRRPNQVTSKDALIRAGWNDTAVGDNSLEKLVSKLRRQLDAGDLNRYIRTVPRQGYQFVEPVTAVEAQEAAVDLELLMAPHRAWAEGRVALESLQVHRIASARDTFQRLVQQHPADASDQIGMAYACAMLFEATRTDPAPDADALRLAKRHARHACALDPHLAEAWVTLGFVLERTGRRADALAALERAVALEPDNWRHQVRLALGSWGETRLRAARRALAQCPQLPLAYWLAATVFVARSALDQAEWDVDRALAVALESPDSAPYSMVAPRWLKGLLRLAAGDAAEAMASFNQELALEGLTAAPPGNGGWLLAVEPLLRAGHDPAPLAPALAVMHLRAH